LRREEIRARRRLAAKAGAARMHLPRSTRPACFLLDRAAPIRAQRRAHNRSIKIGRSGGAAGAGRGCAS
jgi:hypothetical protein